MSIVQLAAQDIFSKQMFFLWNTILVNMRHRILIEVERNFSQIEL